MKTKLFALPITLFALVFALATPAIAQTDVSPATEISKWLVGKFTGTQTVASRPSWPSAPINIEIAENGVWKLDLGGTPGPATVNGVVTSFTGSAAVLKGKYISGRNYGKEIEYRLSKMPDGKITGTIEADWITMAIEVDLRPVPKPPIADTVVQTMFRECLDAFGIPDGEGCSKTPQP